MPHIHLETRIRAPIERCFDLMRDVDAHVASTTGTRERAVAGVTTGLLQTGDTVTWEAVHFGVKQRLTVRVTRCEPPWLFEDEMVQGALQSFMDRHTFREEGGETVMEDDFRYTAPLGFIGRIADWLFLERYMRRFLQRRADRLRRVAEASALESRAETRGASDPPTAL